MSDRADFVPMPAVAFGAEHAVEMIRAAGPIRGVSPPKLYAADGPAGFWVSIESIREAIARCEQEWHTFAFDEVPQSVGEVSLLPEKEAEKL